MSFPVRFFVNVAAVALILVYDILHFLLMVIVTCFLRIKNGNIENN